MSLFPLNLNKYKKWSVEQLYYLLYPYIMEDFMGKPDCKTVHAEGNMQAIVSGATGTVSHILRGGTDIQAKIKKAEYLIKSQEGRIVIEGAQITGQFLG
jgi:hypothetical protein